MNAKTLEAIRKHGESLLRAFPNASEKDPVALCKKLRRVETATHLAFERYCNGDVCELEADKAEQIAINRLNKVLNLFGTDWKRIVINRDPRGYAIKLDSTWTHNRNAVALRDGEPQIYRDMGGYGILAPDLNQ